jgi:hypothetical protein
MDTSLGRRVFSGLLFLTLNRTTLIGIFAAVMFGRLRGSDVRKGYAFPPSDPIDLGGSASRSLHICRN